MSENWMSVLYVALAVVVFCAGAAAIAFGMKTHTITRTHVVKVERSWGKPDQSISAAQVNPQLAQLGITVCDYYQSRHTLVCH